MGVADLHQTPETHTITGDKRCRSIFPEDKKCLKRS